jgi:ubiquinone biosynthesis protein COQ9
MPIDSSISAQETIFKEALRLLESQNITLEMLENASKNAGYDPLFFHTIFITGCTDFATYMHERLDQEMVQSLTHTPLTSLPVRQRIFQAVKTRLEIAARHKEAYRKLHYFMAQPSHLLLATSCNWKTASIIWHLAGDTSVDFNYYTKRSLLLAVYTSTLLYWLKDNSEGHKESWEFLERRIKNVLSIETYKQKLMRFLS